MVGRLCTTCAHLVVFKKDLNLMDTLLSRYVGKNQEG